VHWLTDPWSYAFFRHGVLAAVLAGGLCGLIGVYVVLRRLSAIGHGLAHSVFGGAVVGYSLGSSLYVVGGLWGAMSVLAINAMGRERRIGGDAAIGIVTTASFALGVAIISRGHSFTRNFEAALFGNILGVTSLDLWILAAVTAVAFGAVFAFYRPLLFVTFDESAARTFGVPTRTIDVGFALLLSAIVVATMRVLGVTLIASAVVTPAVAARLTSRSFGRVLGTSVAIGAGCGLVGMYASYYYDIASGATITLAATIAFVLVAAVSSTRGWWAGRRGPVVDGGDPDGARPAWPSPASTGA
jgi:manganese/iron transport system permease protein/iron/zinc/copper transport system permease protein